jgi:Flp pilus assembly protein TadD
MDDAKAAVQAKKWRDALAAVQAAEEFDPESPMVTSYKATIQIEMSSASALSMARMHMESKEWDKAMGALQGVSADSELKDQAAALKKELDTHLLDDLLVQGQKMMEAKQFNQAILKFDEVLRQSPDNAEALVAKRMAEEAVEKEQRGGKVSVGGGGRRKRNVKIQKESHGAGLTGQALALYKNGEVERAIDKAENGGASGEELSRLRQFKSAYDKAMDAAKNAGQPGQAVEALLKAYGLDKQIAGGQGEYRRILSEKLAKAYMVKGVDAHTGRRLPEAYKAYRSALQFDPNLPKVKERLEDLKREAKKLYEEAYVIKATNQELAISKLKTVLQIVPPDEIYYGKAKKLLGSLQGEADGQDSGGDSF